MIWFILIYVITLILFGAFIYIDMEKGETLQHYFQYIDAETIINLFIPILNTGFIICIFILNLLEKFRNKIK